MRGENGMTKKERLSVMNKLKPTTWYAFCQLEAMNGTEVHKSNNQLVLELNTTAATIARYLAAWTAYKLIKPIPGGGFYVVPFGEHEDGITGEIEERKFSKAKDIVDYWCKIYHDTYGQEYMVSNWGMVVKNTKKLLIYSDDELESTIHYAVTQYKTRWVNKQFPRPTLGQLCSWLFAQALPFASKPKAIEQKDNEDDNLLNDLVEKGWI